MNDCGHGKTLLFRKAVQPKASFGSQRNPLPTASLGYPLHPDVLAQVYRRRHVQPHKRRHDNLTLFATGFANSVQTAARPAPAVLKQDTVATVWDVAAIRQQIPQQISGLRVFMRSGYVRGNAGSEAEFNLRIMRLSLALCVLDTMDKLSKAVLKKDSAELTTMFKVAATRLKSMLDDSYFSKTKARIIFDYREAEPALAACAAACSVRLPSLYDAVKQYKKNVACLIRQL